MNSQNEKAYEYAVRQEDVEKREKTLIAKWVTNNFPFGDGDGILLDAGSSCLAVWDEFSRKIGEDITHLSFWTNNFQVLKRWASSREYAIRETQLEILGSVLDPSHQAFFGPIARQALTPSSFRPKAVYIGCSGVVFDPNEGILFSYHAGDRERDFKQLLFQCSCSLRFILATGKKVGAIGAHAFDILSIRDVSSRGPIYLVTTEPEPETREQFEQSKAAFQKQEMAGRIRRAGLDFHWVILDSETGEQKEHLEVVAAPHGGAVTTQESLATV